MTDLVEPVGKKLAKAREAKGLSLEEAGLETRIRPQQLAALEADDYSSFASNTYARGFLLIYGKFLGVEVRGIAKQLESGNPISIAEYQYLNAFPEDESERSAPSRRDRREREPKIRRPSVVPLIVFFLLLGAVGLGIHLYLQAERLETAQNSDSTNTIEAVTPRNNAPEAASSASTTPAPAPSETAPIAPRPTPVPFAAPRLEGSDRAFVIPPSSNATPTPAPSATTAPTATVQPTPAPLPVVNELVVEPLKKTWVRIRRDNDTDPIYDDLVYPKVGPLRLKGTKFFVEIREADAVTIRKNGQTIAYQPPGVTVQ